MPGLVFGKEVALSVVPESSERSSSDPAGKVGAVAAHDPTSRRVMSMLVIVVLEKQSC